jgi:glycosyltransferase involved in cell wall biosynthesis
MDLFALPSLKEAMPVALLEAMASRLPVVATSVGGVPEIVRDGQDGLLVPPGSVGALRGALETLLCNPTLARRLAEAGHARVISRFTIEGMVRRVERTYERTYSVKQRSLRKWS